MPLNRYLIAAGTEHYAGGFPRLDEVPAELEKVVGIFRRFDYVEQLIHLRRDPQANLFQVAVEKFLRAPERTSEDVVVIYYTGHGFTEGPHHYLAAANTESDSIATAMDSAFFVRLRPKGSPLGHVLVILDACSSAVGAVSAAEIGTHLRDRGAAEGTGVWTLAAAGSREEAFQGAFADSLVRALEDSATASGTVPEHVAVETLVHHINKHLKQRYGDDQRAFYSPPGGLAAGTPPFFVNPGHARAGAFGIDLETRRRLGPDLAAHFDPKSRGVDRAADPGSYFTGRTAALQTLLDWLANGEDPRPRVVCGQPGAGMSAVLGRLLTLCGSIGQPSELPTLESPRIDAAVLARNKDVPRLTRELSAALGLPALHEPADLVSELTEREPVTRIVIDALDEADEPLAIASDLLLPLVRDTNGRVLLVLACRETTRRRLPFDHVPLNLDTPQYLRAEDLVDYVTSVLLAAGDPNSSSPYRGHEQEARTVALEVGARAGGNFLIARVAARTVSRGSRMLEPGELASMAAVWRAIDTAFERDLARYDADADRVYDLLTPLAWTRGSGLPWETLWAPIATAISGMPYGDDDVVWVQEHAGAYVVEAEEDGRAVFRLIHQELADHLRDDHLRAKIESSIVDACIEQVPRRADGALDWPLAHPYLRRHLAAHAADAEMIDKLLVDPGFLVAADPDSVSRAARRAVTPLGAEAAAVHLLAAEELDDVALPERAARLALVAHERMQMWLVSGLEPLLAASPWTPGWSDWAGADPSRVVTRLPSGASGLAALYDGVRWLYAAGDTSGTMRVVDALTEEWCLEEDLGAGVWTIRPALIAGRWFILAGDREGRLHAWSVLDWTHKVCAAHGSGLGAIVAGEIDGAPVVFTAGRLGRVDFSSAIGRSEGPGVIRSWDPRSWIALTPERPAFWGGIRQLDLVDVDGSPVLLATGDAWKDPAAAGGAVRAFDPRSLEPLFDLPTGRPPVTLSALTPDRALLLLEFADAFKDRLSRWDVPSRTMTATAEVADGSTKSVALAHLYGAPVVAATLRDGIQLFDAATLAPLAGWRRIASRDQQVLCSAEPGGRSILLSAGADGAVHEWDLGWANTTAPNRKEASGVYSLAVGRNTQDECVIASRAGGVEVRNLADGEKVWQDPRPANVVAVAGQRVVLGDRGGMLRAFDLPGWREGPCRSAHDGGVNHVDLYAGATGLMCASTGSDHRVRLWDGDTLEPMAPPLVHTGYEDKSLGMLAFARWKGELTLFAGGSRGQLVTWEVENLPPEDSVAWTLGTVDRDMASAHRDSMLSLTVLTMGDFDVLFSGGWAGQVLGLRLDTGEWWDPEGQHRGPVRAMCTASAGSEPILVTGGDDEFLAIWHVSKSGFELSSWIPLGSPVRSLAGSGSTVVVGTAAGLATVQLRDAAIDVV